MGGENEEDGESNGMYFFSKIVDEEREIMYEFSYPERALTYRVIV